jgi:dienelactone hydrolase
MAGLVSAPPTPGIRESLESFGRHGSLAGILTLPMEGASGTPVVLLGAGILHKVGPSRASVELARSLAAAGHPTLRFDLSGIGDSPRVDEPSLSDTAVQDIRDAVSLVVERSTAPEGVALVGFCSGADNALFVGAEDPRVGSVVLFDPTVHRTAGYERRRMVRRLLSPRSWWNVLSGRSLALRTRVRMAGGTTRPPGYYGLLTPPPEETDRRVAALVRRGARITYVLSQGCHGYCNAPTQVRESLPTGFSPEYVTVLWEPEMDHILSTRTQRDHLTEVVLGGLAPVPSRNRRRTGMGAEVEG